ncbi:MAG: hypothetical protein UR32_C0003G0044 [candidate division WS6 bacterium GW2011_GWE2_33_157]|nr:MAG: hypothetical protein UR32_C0003G0044 [candidate division WS6 bacterium GW2011_GWE2_33_157]KKP55563.1 MAG: hypothetical protein UR45_C0001G0045 [candidate division WS6 bacterium GW2011_WS6_33_547]
MAYPKYPKRFGQYITDIASYVLLDISQACFHPSIEALVFASNTLNSNPSLPIAIHPLDLACGIDTRLYLFSKSSNFTL